MPAWPIVELDRDERRRRVVDPMELVALIVVALVALAFSPRLLNGNSTTVEPRPVASAGPFVAPGLASSLTLSARALAVGECGAFSATAPASSFGDAKPRAIRRIDAALSVAADRLWLWCVAGARVYADGIEVLGRFMPQRDPTGGERPRAALRLATFGGQIEGYGALGPAEIVRGADGYSLLRLRAVTDNGRRLTYRNASDRAGTLTLRLVAIAGPWSFGPLPVVDGPVGVAAVTHGITFQLRDLHILPDGVAATTHGRGDMPDPALVTTEWEVGDDAGTVYRPLPDAGAGGAGSGLYRAFQPAPPANATSLDISIRRVYLSSLREFAVTLPLVP